jgi:glycosyltransferase involved in cell wall biosynthesis
MKILRVITSMNPKSGGPCQGIRNVNPYIKQLGIEVEVICMDAITDEYDTNDDFVIHKLGRGKTAYQYQPLLYNWLVKNASEFDCIVVHGLWQHYNVAVYNAVKHLKKYHNKVPKVAIMPHGMMDPYFQTASDRKLKALRNDVVWHFIEKKCINEADAIFYTCQEELRLATTTFKGYNPKKTINVSYGIQAPPQRETEFDNAFFQKCSKVLGKEYWLFLSRIHEKKGVDLLIKAYSELATQNSSLPELVIAGPVESPYAQQMIKMASGNSKIHFSGMLQGKEKWGAFYNCQAYLLPSHQENFGIAIVEALACEKPVLITNKVNIYREIEDGGGGLVSNDTYEGVLEVLKKWEGLSQSEQTEMGENAFTLYQNHFNIKSAAERLNKVLKSLI